MRWILFFLFMYGLLFINPVLASSPEVTTYWNNINGSNKSSVTINASEYIEFGTIANQTLNTVRYRVKLVDGGGYVTEQNTSANFTRTFPSFGLWYIEQTGYNANGSTQSIEVFVTVDFNKTGRLNVFNDHVTSPIRESNNTENSVSSPLSYSPVNILNITHNITGLVSHHWHYNSTTEEGVYTQSHKNNFLVYQGLTYYTSSSIPTEVTGFGYRTYNNSDIISVSTLTNGGDITNVDHSSLSYTYYAPNFTQYCNNVNGCNQTFINISSPTTISFNGTFDKTISNMSFIINGTVEQNTSSTTFNRLFNGAGNYNVSMIGWAVDNNSITVTITVSYSSATPSTPSTFTSSGCQNVGDWGNVGFDLILVLLVVFTGVLAIGSLTGDKINIMEGGNLTIMIIIVVIVGLVSVAIVNPIFNLLGC